jgi:hypothetical protein
VEVESLLYKVYGVPGSSKGSLQLIKKGDYAKALENKIARDISKYSLCIDSLTA